MAEPVVGWLRAGFTFRDSFNPNPVDPLENRTVLARAYEGFGLTVNTPPLEWAGTQPPENAPDPEAYTQGWNGSFKGGEKPWL
jgi:hypothetical protein